MSEVVIANVSVWFDDRQRGRVMAVDDVSATIGDGEFVCIVGPSGCGKSTLLNVIGGLARPSAGAVFVDQRPASGPGPDRGMVFQSYTLYPWLTVRANIEFGLQLARMPSRQRRAISDRLLELVRLEGFADAYPKALSGGMRQRVAIARALANNPLVLLMDEPFGALDAQTRALMQELLLDVWQRDARTVLFVTHDIDEAIFLADRVLIMSHRPGRIRLELPVPLHRPREYSMLATPEFGALKRQVLDIIHEESVLALQHARDHAAEARV
ncbi:MAG: ABC transporter ATP-binding protein [Thermomicrobiales bacterium]|nr:ABC transporter ATP-binding protein [Thermomicrobiales bacterium]